MKFKKILLQIFHFFCSNVTSSPKPPNISLHIHDIGSNMETQLVREIERKKFNHVHIHLRSAKKNEEEGVCMCEGG